MNRIPDAKRGGVFKRLETDAEYIMARYWTRTAMPTGSSAGSSSRPASDFRRGMLTVNERR